MLTILLPLEPDPLLLPNKRNKTYWQKTGEATRALKADAVQLLRPMVNRSPDMRRYIEQEELAVEVETVWRRGVTRFDTEATAMLMKPVIDALEVVHIIRNDNQIARIAYLNHFTTEKKRDTLIAIHIQHYTKPDYAFIDDHYELRTEEGAMWFEWEYGGSIAP